MGKPAKNKMAPTIIFIRHAEARHNATRDYNIPDPALTELGFGTQCDVLAKHLENELPLAQEIELIVVSPMRRTLQTSQVSKLLAWTLSPLFSITALGYRSLLWLIKALTLSQQALGWLMKKGVPVVLRAEFQENSAKPCDTGSPIPEMEKEWPQFDVSAIRGIPSLPFVSGTDQTI